MLCCNCACFMVVIPGALVVEPGFDVSRFEADALDHIFPISEVIFIVVISSCFLFFLLGMMVTHKTVLSTPS